MDFNQQLNNRESVYQSNGQSLGAVPRVLTVSFSAGNYRGRHEAWAGLALEITKEIEDSMTRAQWFSTCWRNARRNNSKTFYFKFIFPGLLLTILAVCIGWAAWKLLDRSSVKDLKYGSIFATFIAIVWSSINAVISVFRPVSQQMSKFFSLPDYSECIGYQQKVITDIQFLKEEIGRKPYFIFSFIDGEKCKDWFGLWKDSVKQTPVPKYGSAPKDKLRIIAFVDDLDHCEDEVILRVLWAINLVFRVCEINVILAMDKNTIEEALKKSSHNQEKDFVDKFISKTIQLPVNLPDPEDDEWSLFLEKELEREPSLSKYAASPSQTVVQPVSEGDGNAQGTEGGRQHVPVQPRGGDEERGFEGCIPYSYRWLVQRVPGISCFLKKVLDWQKWILYILYLVACNVRDQSWPLPQPSTEPKPLTKRMRELREMLMISYTSAEVETFNRLKVFATGNQKVPREWKNYLNYHKFARTVVSKKVRKGSTNYPVGWEMEFVAWTFACWQWKHEMNLLIQDSGMYLRSKENGEDWEMYLPSKENDEQPSLKDIVDNYIQQRWPQCRPQTSGREIDESILVKRALDTIHNVSVKGVQGFKELSFKGDMSHVPLSIPTKIARFIKEEKEERERWNNLIKALETVKDVSMEGIQCFQQFRFHCEPKNLSRAEESKQLDVLG